MEPAGCANCQSVQTRGAQPFRKLFRWFSILLLIAAAGISLGAPEYLLFLKLRKDGRYEPVSGRVDPEFSVRELHAPLPRHLERLNQ
jgi:hypothetical protein